jgi:hypothetical protein
MSERRRGERVDLQQAGMGTVRVIQDVEIAHFDATEAVVIAARTIPLGERLLLEIPDQNGGLSNTRLARAVNSRVILRSGGLRHEVRLLITARAGEADDAPERFARLEDRRKPLGGAVIRRVPVRIVQVSSSGCLWESPSALDEGTVGFVDVRTFGQRHTEAVRILRARRSIGPIWPFRMAVEFLTLGPTSPDSLRGVAALVAVGAPSPTTPSLKTL